MTDDRREPPPDAAAPGERGDGVTTPPGDAPADLPVTARAAALSDGEWHRLHPASPLLKGGIALIAIIGIVIANLRERLIEFFVPQAGYDDGDPIDLIVENGVVGYALLAVLALLLVLVLIFYVS